MLSVFNSLTPYSYKTGGRIPRGWSYYTDSSGIHFNTSANLVSPKGRYVSFWRTRVNCYTSGGGLVKVPASTRTITKCKTTQETKSIEKKLCVTGSINIRCSSENSNGCHGGVAKSYTRHNPTLPAPPSGLPSCCGSSSACPNCTPQDWTNWTNQQACEASTAELCIYYDCCGHICDRAIFDAVFYVPQKVLGYNSDGTPILSEAREEQFLTANLNNGDDGGPRGPFCATIPKPTLASWTETKIINKTQCFTEKLTISGYQYYLPADVRCSDSEFALVIDVKDSGETLNATTTYEGGFDAQPSGIVLYTSFSDTLPNPSPLGKALLNLYKGAKIRRAGWASTRYIENNNGFFKLTGCSNNIGLPSGWNGFNPVGTNGLPTSAEFTSLPIASSGYYTFTIKQKILSNQQYLRLYVGHGGADGSSNSNLGFHNEAPIVVTSIANQSAGHLVTAGSDNAIAYSTAISGTASSPDGHYALHRITAGLIDTSIASFKAILCDSSGNTNIAPTTFYLKDFTYTKHTRKPQNSGDHAPDITDISATTLCTMPTEDDIRAGDWQSFGQTADASALTCKSLDTYNEPKIAFAREAWSPSGIQYGDDAQPRVITPSAGHNGRKIDGMRNKFAFNFTHTLPPSTKTRKLYTHILTEKIFDNKLSTLFAEEWQQAEGALNPASKVYFVYHTGGSLNEGEGRNDATYNFNNDSLFQGELLDESPYGHIWHNLKDNMKATKPNDLPAHLYMHDVYYPYPTKDEIFVPENARSMPFKREIPLQDVEIVKIYIHVPPRDVPTKLICSASSFISKVSEPNPPEEE
jgi:hypothetical protein